MICTTNVQIMYISLKVYKTREVEDEKGIDCG